MHLRRRSWSVGAAALVAVLAPSAAFASTASGTLAVSATVLSTATVTTLPLAFGNYDPTSGTATLGTGSAVVTATAGTPYTLALDNGLNVLSSQRRLSDGSGHHLSYNLFSDSARTTAWNNVTTVSGTGTALPQTYTIYGSIPANQSAPTGVYSDTVTVTASF
jgi:spore coat protein U-like protein